MLPTQFFFFFLNLATFPSRFFTALLPRDRRPRSSTAGERRPLPAFASPFFSPCHPFIRLSQPFRALHGALRQRQSRCPARNSVPGHSWPLLCPGSAAFKQTGSLQTQPSLSSSCSQAGASLKELLEVFKNNKKNVSRKKGGKKKKGKITHWEKKKGSV